MPSINFPKVGRTFSRVTSGRVLLLTGEAWYAVHLLDTGNVYTLAELAELLDADAKRLGTRWPHGLYVEWDHDDGRATARAG